MTQPSPVAAILMPHRPERTMYDREYVRSLFDSIAHRYDFLNHVLSFGFDILWRKKAIALLKPFEPQRILDVATGTGDLAIDAARSLKAEIVAVDVSTKMLRLCQEKILRTGLETRIQLIEAYAEDLRFDDSSFDAVTVAFGVRNFSDLKAGLSQMHRVLESSGVALILEFSKPRNKIIRKLYGFYFQRILPVIGGIVSGNKEAYRYLPNTVGEFPAGLDFLGILHEVGFSETIQYPLTFGIATVYIGIKR